MSLPSRIALSAAALLCLVAPASAQPEAPDPLWQAFLSPPADARPMVRWWWFGPAVDTAEIDREIRAMKQGGFGGFEVQAVYPLSPDDAPRGLRNTPYLSPLFLDALRHAAQTAGAERMRIDVTAGSGWPFGGPHIPVTQASAEIRRMPVTLPAGAAELVLPAVGPGERILGVSLGGAMLRLPADGARVPLTPAGVAREAELFVAGRTGQQVKRAAVGAEGFVLDHMDAAAVDTHLAAVAAPLLRAFDGLPPPHAIFSDSLEAYGASWTGDLPAEFRRRRGYDLLPRLGDLFGNAPGAAAVRFDWARTLTELVDERYVGRLERWAQAHGTRLRLQGYGIPPTTLSSNALVSLPEGEGADWRSFTSTRWATSAAHLYGKPVVSSEVWTWLHSPTWAATPLDMKVEADRHFLQGVTQLVGHGWPYSAPGVAEPGWAFYAAAALNDHNPWYGVMPEVTRYLQRISFALRQGAPANKVAIYLPTEDAMAAMRPARASINDQMRDRVPAALVGQVLDTGNGFDFIDAAAVRARGIGYAVLVLPALDRIDGAAFARVEHWVRAGGHVVAVGHLPDTAGGLRDAAEAARVRSVARRLSRMARVSIVAPDAVGAAIRAATTPDIALAAPASALGIVHRRLPAGDLYLVVNTGNTPLRTTARFAGDRGNGEWWDAMTGERRAAGTGSIPIELAPYQSLILRFEGAAKPPATIAAAAPGSATPLDAGWTLQIDGRAPVPLPRFASWTEQPALRFFSGTAIYRRSLSLADASPGRCIALDFGSAQAAPAASASPDRPQAALDAPVRDAVEVFVNGRRAGSVWAPPYRLDLTPWLRGGANAIELRVSNTAINRLAAQPPADFRLLTARYGERFKMQDQEKIAPAPSGLLRPPSLVRSPRADGCRP